MRTCTVEQKLGKYGVQQTHSHLAQTITPLKALKLLQDVASDTGVDDVLLMLYTVFPSVKRETFQTGGFFYNRSEYPPPFVVLSLPLPITFLEQPSLQRKRKGLDTLTLGEHALKK